ncbi:hypothetical protein BBO99_00002055 [Phytophthora kernoviae]|uniref:Uncharacterized protein n=1 Tax=Phytophthora kernoviae TaxID=325452 RepID=A0A3R7IQA0_9STRA|nr:hypothetical protein BBI17_001940 [Phytophthora kernoviae]RLN83525.1 hypothetical protein BBO99_00002055 [Phytophthora kernoviae]
MKKCVRWSTVTVYEFGVGLGGSAVPKHGGPSIGLARKPRCVWSTAVDDALMGLENIEEDEQGATPTSPRAKDKKKSVVRTTRRRKVRWLKPLERGVHVATFATITWETFTDSRNQPKLRPTFFLSDTFIKTYGLSQKRPPLPSATLAPLEDINFTKIAIKFSHSLTKDLVFSGVRDMVQKIGYVASTGAPVSITFNFGRLIAKNRCISVLFDPLKFPRALEDYIARSMISSPPSVLGNLDEFDISPEDVVDYSDTIANNQDGQRRPATTTLSFSSDDQEALPTSRSNPENIIGSDVSIEEELQMYDALLSPGSNASERSAKHHVMESAFKRHITNLAHDVDLEAKYSFDSQLQQRRDLDAVALETKTRRMCAEDLQRHLRMQMQQREDCVLSERNERRTTDPQTSSFYSDSERSRQGYHDQLYLHRVKEQLKHQLQDQISSNEQDRITTKQKTLQDDRLFLRRVRNELETIEKKQAQDREELRKSLTGSWNRDSHMKKLVEVRKKQRAAEYVQQDGPNKQDHNSTLVPSRLSIPRQDTARDDYSVGFDIRSMCGD